MATLLSAPIDGWGSRGQLITSPLELSHDCIELLKVTVRLLSVRGITGDMVLLDAHKGRDLVEKGATPKRSTRTKPGRRTWQPFCSVYL